ncbi:MAG: AraC family transcriptional regulator [Candidatus Accumulibacter propinquus]|jgi:AraC-like DNA-binding protein|uniref:AraC family transcriptional regulator n=1 Tax=Candidatus Accumulibacter propinquus TaxID=2954380 RepID=UPI002FC2DEFB
MADQKSGKFSLPLKGEVRVAPLAAIPELLREFGVIPGPLLKSFGLTEDFFRHPDNTTSFQLLGRLIKACVRETGCPHFGLLIGQRGNVSSLGATGFLMRNAPDVGTALNEAIINIDLHDRGAAPFIEVTDETTVLGYTIYQPGIVGGDQIADGSLAVIWNIMRALCGPEWLPIEVRFRRNTPVDFGAYRRFFQAPLCFNASHNALVFQTSWLTKSVQLADPLLRQHFLQHIQELRLYSNNNFREMVYEGLLLLLGAQRCTLKDLASHFSMHQRTLIRRLSEAGTSFRELHKEARHQTARQLLIDTRSSIETIATLLGYSGGNAFNRAFFQWEGVPPAKWRRQMLTAIGQR